MHESTRPELVESLTIVCGNNVPGTILPKRFLAYDILIASFVWRIYKVFHV